MHVDSVDDALDHQLTFAVPEDGIYPLPAERTPTAVATNIVPLYSGGSLAGYTWVTELRDVDGAVVASIPGFSQSYWYPDAFLYHSVVSGYVSNSSSMPIQYGAPKNPDVAQGHWQVYNGAFGYPTQAGGGPPDYDPWYDTGTWSPVSPTYESLVIIPSASLTAFNARRKAWFKKNSDEFIAALKTGFAPGAEGVTRPELQLGRVPDAWDFQIKRDVDTKYNSYPPSNTIGRKTHRDILYTEVAGSFSETVQSDTSADLTQAGVKVTKRMVTLQYQITVNDEVETREANITGYLTQTVTRHNDAQGNQLGLSRQDVYDTWYNQESTSLPTGVPSMVTAPYLKDRTTSRIGVILNGIVQDGYNADSTRGAIDNPLAFALFIPPFPAAYSTVTATVPEYIATWHKDSKIVYDKTGVGASNTLNDSALHGVTEVHLTPVGLISDGPTYVKVSGLTATAQGDDGTFAPGVYRFRVFGINAAAEFTVVSNIATVTVTAGVNDTSFYLSWDAMDVDAATTGGQPPEGYVAVMSYGGKEYWKSSFSTDLNWFSLVDGYPDYPFDATDPDRKAGIFSDRDGSRVEIYGTAVYAFNWQEGLLTFKSWKPLHDSSGNEVTSKTVVLPDAAVWSDLSVNCIVTYKGVHWPDVVTALKVRDKSLPTATADYDKLLYTLIQAVKAG